MVQRHYTEIRHCAKYISGVNVSPVYRSFFYHFIQYLNNFIKWYTFYQNMHNLKVPSLVFCTHILYLKYLFPAYAKYFHFKNRIFPSSRILLKGVLIRKLLKDPLVSYFFINLFFIHHTLDIKYCCSLAYL